MLKHHWFIVKVLPKGVQGLAAPAPKANKQAGVDGKEVCFISDAGNLARRDGTWLSKGQHSSPCTGNQWGKSFIERGRVGSGDVLHAEAAQSAFV